MRPAPLPDPGWWGLSGPLQPLTGGTRARVFRAGAFVFKSTGHSEASLRWLGRVHRLAERSGLAVPKLLPTTEGTLVKAGWTAEPFVDGKPCAPNKLPGLAARMARFHRLTTGIPARPGHPGAVDPHLPATVPPVLAARLRRALLRECGPVCAVHGDLNAANLHLSGRGIAVIDWDEARRDHALFDRMPLGQPGNAEASLAWEVIACWQPEPDRARRLARMLLRGQARRFLADSLMASYWPEGRKRHR